MITPIPFPLSYTELLQQALQENGARIISAFAEASANDRSEQTDQSTLESIQKNLPLLLEELILLLPDVMAGKAKAVTRGASMDFRTEHRLDAVVRLLTGASEVFVLEVLRLKEFVGDGFLSNACREVRHFFELKIAAYCLQFVAAQQGELTLRTKQLEDAAERLLAAAENERACAHSKVQFLQGVTHELRNSLQSVLLYAAAVEEGSTESEMMEVAERLTMNAVQLQKILDRLQSYSPMLANDVHDKLELVDLAGFLNDLEKRHRASARTTQTGLTCKLMSGPAKIRTDLKRLTVIADNLVSNAIYSAKFGAVEVEVSEEDDECMQLKVSDNGNGISLEVARQLFRVLHHFSRSEFHGLKLGLLASRYFAHVLKGELTFQSEVGQGASFMLIIPQNRERV